MRKLLRRFKKFSTFDKVRFIIFFPLLIVARIVDALINIGAFVYRFVIQRYRQIPAFAILLLVTIGPTATIMYIDVYIDETVPTYKGLTQYTAEMYVYTNCHEMSNNFIVAEDGRIRGYVRADEENIDKILAVLIRYDIEDKDKIIKCLEEFRNQDYHSAVWLHNHCWLKLDGEVGYATGLKDRYK